MSTPKQPPRHPALSAIMIVDGERKAVGLSRVLARKNFQIAHARRPSSSRVYYWVTRLTRISPTGTVEIPIGDPRPVLYKE